MKYILTTDRPTSDQRPTTDQRPTDFSFGPYWGNFKWPYLREGSSDPLHVWFYDEVFGVGGSNGAISGFTKTKMAAAAILENSNGDISAADRPIYTMFGSRAGFLGSADRMALFPVSPNPSSRHLGKFKWRYLRGGLSDLLHVWF